MPERERQTPPLIQATESAKRYAQEDIFKSGSFLNSAKELGKKMGSENNPEVIESAKNLLKNGINMAASHIGMLPNFADPENRAEIVEKLKEGEVEGAWIDILTNWNVHADPFGIGVLKKCMEKDVEEILYKAKDAKDEQEKEQIKFQADAIGQGQNLLLRYYKDQVGMTGSKILKMAA